MKTDYAAMSSDDADEAPEKSSTPPGKTASGKKKKRAVAAVSRGMGTGFYTWREVMRRSATLADAIAKYRHKFPARRERGALAPENVSELAPLPGVPSFFGEPEPRPHRRAAIVKELTDRLSDALGQNENFGAARRLLRNWKDDLLRSLPERARTLDRLADLVWEGGEVSFRAEVVENLTLLVEVFSRPARFFDRLAPRYELPPGHFWPYPKRNEIDSKAEKREFTARALGQTLHAFGVAVLLNDDVRRAFLDLSRHSRDFAMMLAIAEGREVAATYGRTLGRRDSPGATRQKPAQISKLYDTVVRFLSAGSNKEIAIPLIKTLREFGVVDQIKAFSREPVSDETARSFALSLVRDKFPDTNDDVIQKAIARKRAKRV